MSRFEGWAWVLVFNIEPEEKRDRLALRLAQSRKRNQASSQPGWIDTDPPTWAWSTNA